MDTRQGDVSLLAWETIEYRYKAKEEAFICRGKSV